MVQLMQDSSVGEDTYIGHAHCRLQPLVLRKCRSLLFPVFVFVPLSPLPKHSELAVVELASLVDDQGSNSQSQEDQTTEESGKFV